MKDPVAEFNRIADAEAKVKARNRNGKPRRTRPDVVGDVPLPPEPVVTEPAVGEYQPTQTDPAPQKSPQDVLAELVDRYVLETKARQTAREQLAIAEFARPDPPRTLVEIKAYPKHIPGFRVDGLVQLRGFLSVVAARKVGKTSLIGSLLLAVLDGSGPALGRVEWEVLAPLDGDVLILSYEMGEEWQDWLDKAGVTTDYGQRVRLWDLLGTANPLTTAAGRTELAGYLDGVSLVIIDTFSQAYTSGLGGGGGVNEDVNAWLNMVRGIIGPDRSLWLSVHAGWDGSRSRGASAIEDQPTSIITLEQAADGTRFISTRGRRVEEVRRLPLRQDPDTLRVTVNPQGPAWSVANAKETPEADDDRHRAAQNRRRDRAIEAKESDQWSALRFLAGEDAPTGRRLITAGTPLSDGAARVALDALGLRGCAEQLPKRQGWHITATGSDAIDSGRLPPLRGK